MPAGTTYTTIESQTLVGNASSVTFSSIPSTYTDLRLVCLFNSSAYAVGGLQFNGVTSGYSAILAYAPSSTKVSGQGKIPFQQGYGPITEASAFQICTVDIFSYKNTSVNKAVQWQTGNPTTTGFPGNEWGCGLFPSTAAITSVTIDSGGTNIFQPGSTFSLYGIAAA
jgi:hypothetical protein